MSSDIKSLIKDHLKTTNALLDDEKIISKIQESIALICQAFQSDQKILFCGNGGSAADAEHLAGELSGKFKMDRAPLYAEALHVNSAALTAVANDYSYEEAFSRLLEAKGKANDVLFILSTSGRSPNILKAMKKARNLSLKVIGMSGDFKSSFGDLCDIHIKIPSGDTPRIQEMMMLAGHIICEKVEKNLFS